MNPTLLYESPFTHLHPLRLDGLSGHDDAGKPAGILTSIHETTA